MSNTEFIIILILVLLVIGGLQLPKLAQSLIGEDIDQKAMNPALRIVCIVVLSGIAVFLAINPNDFLTADQSLSLLLIDLLLILAVMLYPLSKRAGN